jgi:hypothetical protein
VALLLSLLVHAMLLGMLVLGIAPTDFLGSGAAVLPPPPRLSEPPAELQVLHLGLEDSDADTRTWIGYRDPQEQLAPRSEVDQAAFEADPAGGAAGVEPRADAPQSTPGATTMDATAAPAQPPLAEQPPLLEQPPALEPLTRPEDTSPQQPLPEAPPLPEPPREPAEQPRETPSDEGPPALEVHRPEPASEAQVPDAGQRSVEELTQLVESLLPSRQLLERWLPAPRAQPADAQSPDPATPLEPAVTPAPPVPPARTPEDAAEGGRISPPPTASAPGPPRQRGADGDPSDRESDATSTVDVPPEQWRRGRPVAARGLDIKTRRPVFPELTSLTARPSNPVVEVFFDQTGTPRRASVIKGSGDARVDGPLIDALYRWRASGEALKRLEEGELFRIELRILLAE